MKIYPHLITAAELAAYSAADDFVIFDSRFDLSDPDRGYKSYRDAHIPGAVYAHLDQHLSSAITPASGRHPLPDAWQLIRWLSASGVGADTQVIVYDDSFGTMAARLWWLLKWLGHNAVALLDGGYQAWQKNGLTLATRNELTEVSSFHGQPIDALVLSTDELQQHIGSLPFRLIDVRTAERFLGINEPIDPVAGHIPGAINIPLTQNINAQGYFKSPQELALQYADSRQSAQAVMCGSGVTAAHTVFAMSYAGLPMPRLYAGSWSEWIRDASRPIAKD